MGGGDQKYKDSSQIQTFVNAWNLTVHEGDTASTAGARMSCSSSMTSKTLSARGFFPPRAARPAQAGRRPNSIRSPDGRSRDPGQPGGRSGTQASMSWFPPLTGGRAWASLLCLLPRAPSYKMAGRRLLELWSGCREFCDACV